MNSEDWKWIRFGWVVAVLLAGAFAGSAALKTEGKPFPPFDDAFIYLRYAERLAGGHWYSYGEGSGFTTGATSPLYPWLLAPAFWVGLSGTKAVPASLAWGVLFLMGSMAAIYELTKRLTHCLAALGSLVFLCASGYSSYFYLAGMETGLYAFALLASLVAAGRFEARPSRKTLVPFAGLVALLPLARPEGLFVALLMAGWLALRRRDFLAGVPEKAEGVPAKTLWLALALAAVPLVFWQANVLWFTGTLETNGHALKGVMSNPTATLGQKLAFVGDALGRLATGFYANEYDYYFMRGAGALAHPPFLLPVALFGLLATMRARGERLEKPGLALLTLGTIALAAGSTALNEVFHAHNYRYQAPSEPLLLAAYAAGLWRLCELAVRVWEAPPLTEAEREALGAKPLPKGYPAPGSPEWGRDRLFMASAGVVALVLASSLPWWVDFYSDNAADIYNQHRRLAWAVEAGIPEGGSIGITDAGALPYYTGANAYDYAGLVTNNAAPSMRQGLGSAWEAVERLPAERLPGLNIAYPNVMAAPDGRHWLGKPFMASALLRNTVTGGERLTAFEPLWKARPELLGSGDVPASALPEGAQVLDALDVADLASEQARDYSFDHGPEPPAPTFAAADPRDVFLAEAAMIDGGRAVGGGERWIPLAPLQPGRRYRLLMRTSRPWSYLPAGAPGAKIEVRSAGREVASGSLAFAPDMPEDAFREAAFDFEAPADLASGRASVEIKTGGSLFEPCVYLSYHYFLIDLGEAAPAP